MRDSYICGLERGLRDGSIPRAKLLTELHRIGRLPLRYELSPAQTHAPTYAQALQALRDDCAREMYNPHPTIVIDGKQVVRQFMFAENVKARVEDFNRLRNADGSERSMEDRLRLWENTWLDSCTAVANKAETTEFKVVPIYNRLVTLEPGFNEQVLECDYNALDGERFDSADSHYTWNDWQSAKNVLRNPAWRFAALADERAFKGYLKEYVRIAFKQFQRIRPDNNPDKGMGFFVRKKTGKDELRPLVLDLADSSYASGDDDLDDRGRFARVCPQ